MNNDEIELSRKNADLAETIARNTCAFAQSQGASSVIVFVGVPDGKTHNAWSGARLGRTLELRGLLEFGYQNTLPELKFPVLPTSGETTKKSYKRKWFSNLITKER